MPQLGPDQRSRNRRPRRRNQVASRAPVSEFEEQQELEASRERNDLDVTDLREMSVPELRAVSRDLRARDGHPGAQGRSRRAHPRAPDRARRPCHASGILDVVDEGFGFMRRHGLLPSPDDVYVSSSQVRRFGLRIGDRVSGAVRAPRQDEKYWGMLRVDAVNGVDSETGRRRARSSESTPLTAWTRHPPDFSSWRGARTAPLTRSPIRRPKRRTWLELGWRASSGSAGGHAGA